MTYTITAKASGHGYEATVEWSDIADAVQPGEEDRERAKVGVSETFRHFFSCDPETVAVCIRPA